MFTPINMRSVNSYKSVAVETSVSTADPHQLVNLLFETLLQSLGTAKTAIKTGDVARKSQAITKAVRILEEGLKAGLDMQRGGEIALTLRSLYDYSIYRITEANFKNDVSILDEVIAALAPVADSWKQIRSQVVNAARVA
jgi:flagellar secretion chaperone FliS